MKNITQTLFRVSTSFIFLLIIEFARRDKNRLTSWLLYLQGKILSNNQFWKISNLVDAE